MTDFLIRRDDLRDCRIDEGEAPEIEAGQALLRVESFGLTANNVTYAVFGEAMSYWDFFPAPDGWGRLPLWGFAEVVRSEADGVEEGTRLFGYLPSSSHLVVTPARADATGFVDAAPHRAELPAVYQRYVAVDTDPFYRPDTEPLQALLRPLFFTSFLIGDQLADEGLAARGPVILASASSKTALAAAFTLAQSGDVELIGLTSPGNAEFVAGLGIYNSTVTYDRIGTLERQPATLVDMAGNGAVRHAVHSHFGDSLAHSMVVGMTHWDAPRPDGDLPGPHPQFFFAPDRIARRTQDWGRDGLERRAVDAWQPFCDWSAGWLEPVHATGFDALETAYLEVLEGAANPGRARVVSLSGR